MKSRESGFYVNICNLLITAIFLFFAGPAFSNSNLNKQQEYVADEVLVILADDVNADAEDINPIEGGIVKKQITLADKRKNKQSLGQNQAKKQILRVKLPSGKSVKQAIAEAKKDPRIVRIEPNYKLKALAVPNDPYFNQLWAMRNTGQSGGTANADIDAVSAWNITTGSDTVIVAVIDTGIDYRHPDISANIWTNSHETAGNHADDDHNGYIDDVHGFNFIANDGNVIDLHSHGTHVSGTIAGRGNNSAGVTGVNWRCKLMACRFLDENGSGNTADAIEGINYAVANGANILSNSWGGGGYSAALASAITNAKNHGVLFVAAAGNDSIDCDSFAQYPASYDISNVISVAATDDIDELASFSNYGRNTVHLGAPGVGILSSVLHNNYAYYSGTSMATPHVAGVAALLLAKNPSMSLNELKARLIWTGDEVDSLSDTTITGRRLNAYNALSATPSMIVITPNIDTAMVHGYNWPIAWSSIGGADTVDIYLLKAGTNYLQIANNISNTGEFSWNVPGTVPVGNNYRIQIDDGINSDISDANFRISDTPADYFTQLFSSYSNAFDLSNKSLLLTPDASTSRYSACIREITDFYVDPAGSTNLNVGDDSYDTVSLTVHNVKLYGRGYNKFYVGANGYITFEQGDDDFAESFSSHFAKKRISALFRDFDASQFGLVRYKELEDRAVVTWEDVPEYATNNSNSFQVEMFYAGQIRISWLTVSSLGGLVGISDGTGTGADFSPSEISNYPQCPLAVDSVNISGPATAAELGTIQFTCLARYDDGSTKDVTAGEVNWSVDGNYAAVNENGLVSVFDINSYQQCTVTAELNHKSSSRTFVITDATIYNIAINKCKVKAGKIQGLDSITFAGDFNLTPEIIAAANDVNIRIYSGADDCLVYQQTISTDLFVNTKNVYTYKYKILSGQPGGVTQLKFDLNKNTFTLKAANVDLTGLACPFYVLIDLEDYSGFGIADETIVNGKKLIPVRLLSGYADTLYVSKSNLKISSAANGDSLSVKGNLSVKDDSSLADGLTITWGEQTFTIPGSQFVPVKTNHWKSKYYSTQGPVISADFNLTKCAFGIKIKQVNLVWQFGSVDFNLAFGNYNKTAEVQQQ